MKYLYGESDFEEKVINDLKNNGYTFLTQKEIFEKRNEDETQVILIDEVKDFLIKKYRSISHDVVNRIVGKIIDLQHSSIEIANKDFQKMLIEGVKVKDEKLQQSFTYKIIDFDNINNNRFIVTNQFRMISNQKNSELKHRIPDIVAFVNGLPVVVVELKSPSIDENENVILNAFNQIKLYQQVIPSLFVYNFLNVISDFSTTKFGSLTASYDRYQFWRGKVFSNEQTSESAFNDLLKPKVLLDVVENFTFFHNNKRSEIKIIAGYHQYYGVKDALASISNSFKSPNDSPYRGKGGIFWHTQGSGKSYSMIFLARNLSKNNLFPGTTFLIVTDRNDLENQLYDNFSLAGSYLNQKITKIESISHLTEELKDIKQDGVYFSTVQKFDEKVGQLSGRSDFVIITDEAHRSHNNIDGKYVLDNEKMSLVNKYGYAHFLRLAFPNATFIGFTGTPIENDDKSTSSIFGPVISRYLMSDAERDGVIVPIKFETRKPNLHFDEDELKFLDEVTEKEIKRLAIGSEIPTEIRKKVNRIVQKIENFINDDDRIEGVVKDFLKHYDSRKDVVIGKAMFVAFNREVALKVYKKILELRPEWNKIDDGIQKGEVRVVMVGGNNQKDSEEMQRAAGTSEYRRRLASEFKKGDSNFKIAIVVDMWLTGFDVPELDTLYLDKPIKMHNLMQTIARTNRVYTNETRRIVKECGLVVDYIGIWRKLEEALAFYAGGNIGDLTAVSSANLNELKDGYIRKVQLIYKNFFCNMADFELLAKSNSYRYELINELINHLSKNKQTQNFVTASRPVIKMTKEIISLLNESETVIFNFLSVLRSQVIKVHLGYIDFEKLEINLREQVEKIIKFTNTEVIDEVDEKSINLSSVISFIRRKESSTPYLEKDLKIVATKKIIEEIKFINIVKYKKISESLQDLLNKYNSNFITLEELVSGLNIIATQAFDYQSKSGVIKGEKYTKEEYAFFNILTNEKDLSGFDQEKLELVLKEVLKIINNKQLVNGAWAYNKEMISKVRAELKTVMIRNDYPPKYRDSTRDEIVEQIMYQNRILKEGE